MLKIKLRRSGKNKQSHFTIVVSERRSKAGGKFVDELGYYSPQTDPATIKVDQKKLAAWIAKGAQLTPTLKLLLTPHGPTA